MFYLTTLFTIIPRRCVGCQDMKKQKGGCENTNAFHNDYDVSFKIRSICRLLRTWVG